MGVIRFFTFIRVRRRVKVKFTGYEAFEITPASRDGGLIEVVAMEKRCREICETCVGG